MTQPAIAVPVWPGMTKDDAVRARFDGQEPPEGVELVFIINPLPNDKT